MKLKISLGFCVRENGRINNKKHYFVMFMGCLTFHFCFLTLLSRNSGSNSFVACFSHIISLLWFKARDRFYPFCSTSNHCIESPPTYFTRVFIFHIPNMFIINYFKIIYCTWLAFDVSGLFLPITIHFIWLEVLCNYLFRISM